jgi:metal-dependent amidase/aminoacylase/carboxypeptidase family protein
MQKSKGTEPIRALAFLSHLLPAGADAVVAASSIVLNLQTMVSREFEPMDPLVVTIGSFNSGSRFNIIAGTAELTGTCRSFNQEIYESLPTVMERIVKGTAEALKCTADVEFSRLATLALGSCLTGIFAIYGTTAPLVTVYWVAGLGLLAAALGLYLLRGLRETAA